MSNDEFYRIFVSEKQAGAFSLEENAYNGGWSKYNTGSKDVYLITPEGYKFTFDKHQDMNPQASNLQSTPASQTIGINKNPIFGNSQASVNQMIIFVNQVNPNFDSSIAHHFLKIGEKHGIRGDVALCQSIHETNYFRYGGQVKPEDNNFAGIGATGEGQVNTFATVEEGITAQIQHLYAYASKDPLPPGEKLVDPRFNLVTRGIAPNWEDLSGYWAVPGYDNNKYTSLQEAIIAGESYGQSIMGIYERLLQVRSFQSYSINEFEDFVESLPPLERTITHIQIHHTWKPRKTDYTGEATIYGMWKYHTQTNGWSDIGQHFSIAPNGSIWDGRLLEKDPAGIKGYNAGGIMFEIIGNFDIGEEVLQEEQLNSVIHCVRALLKKFNLELKDIVFHKEHSSKTCPGSGVSKEWFLSQIEGYPPHTPQWKKEDIEWMFKQQLLTDYDWKKRIDEPVPLWALAKILKSRD